MQSIQSKIDNLLHHMSENNMDIFFVTETWLHDKADLQYVTANIQGLDYNIISIERQIRKGGDISCIYKKNIEISKLSTDTYESFKALTVNLKIKSSKYTISTIYRMPSSTIHKIPMTTFLSEFPDHITTLLQTCNELIILGDINKPWNKPNHIDTISMTMTLDLLGLTQLVNFQRHKIGDTTDWIICKNPTRIQNLNQHDFISDLCIIAWEQLTIKATAE